MRKVAAIFVIISWQIGIAFAGGSSGAGAIDWSPSFDTAESTEPVYYGQDDPAFLAELKRRHDLAIEYALENEKFKSLIDELALSLAVSAGVGSVADEAEAIASTLISSIRTAVKSEEQNLANLDADFALQAIEDVSTAVVVGYCPGCGVPVDLGKIAVSFTTGYVYGFFWGI